MSAPEIEMLWIPSWTSRVWAGFKTWRRSRPFWAGLWSMLGGTIIAYIPATGFRFVFSISVLWIGVMVGVLVAMFGLYLWFAPSMRYINGGFIIVLSMTSFVTSDFGGFFLGMLLGILGGSMAMAWTPATSRVYAKKAAAQLAEPVEHMVIDLTPYDVVEQEPEPSEEPITVDVTDAVDATDEKPAVIDVTDEGPAVIDVTDEPPAVIDVTDERVIDLTEERVEDTQT